MAAALNLTQAKVTIDGVDQVAGVQVRNNVATLIDRKTNRVLATKSGVLTVQRSGSPTKFLWELEFDDATSWMVERQRTTGCRSCGGR